MTSEPDSKPDRRPPTIELKATEIENPAAATESAAEGVAAPDQPASNHQSSNELTPEQQAAGPQQGKVAGSRMRSRTVGAIVGAIVIGAIIAGLWLAGFAPWREAAPPPSSPPAVAVASGPMAPSSPMNTDISARLDKI